MLKDHKKYIHFFISGNRVRQKLLRFCLTHFPEHQIYTVSSLSAFRFTAAVSETHCLASFNWDGNPERVLINLGISNMEMSTWPQRRLDRSGLTEAYQVFELWCSKWELEISPVQEGNFPRLSEQDLH